jgi:hypothetical protein
MGSNLKAFPTESARATKPNHKKFLDNWAVSANNPSHRRFISTGTIVNDSPRIDFNGFAGDSKALNERFLILCGGEV